MFYVRRDWKAEQVGRSGKSVGTSRFRRTLCQVTEVMLWLLLVG